MTRMTPRETEANRNQKTEAFARESSGSVYSRLAAVASFLFSLLARKPLRTAAQNLVVYGIAGAIVWYEARHIPFHRLLYSIKNANLWWFVPATLLSVCIWFFGENLMYARMFTYFHKRTGYRELMPATAAAYFLQVVNVVLAAGALVLFLHRRKQTSWMAGSFTILFLGFIDGFLLSLWTLLSGLLIRGSPLRRLLPYAAAVLGALILIAAWWLWRRDATRPERWLRTRRALVSFRRANLKIYFELGLIRAAIFVPQAFIFYVCMMAFHVAIPMRMVVAATPAILAAGGLPFNPVGLGPLQAVAIHTFGRFAPTDQILAIFLLFSGLLLLYRLPLGLGSAGSYVRTVLAGSGEQNAGIRPGPE